MRHPRNPLHDFPAVPEHEEGPVTVTIASEDRERFRSLMQEVQATCRRNGAFHCRLDECLEHPGKFRLEYIVSTWAEHLRQGLRMTVDEARVFDTAWDLNTGRHRADCAPLSCNPEIRPSTRLWLLRSHVYRYIGPIAAAIRVFHILILRLTDLQCKRAGPKPPGELDARRSSGPFGKQAKLRFVSAKKSDRVALGG
jgi:Transmembrane secretion effector